MTFDHLVSSVQDSLSGSLGRHRRRHGIHISTECKSQRSVLPWNWIAEKLAELLTEYPGGITDAILLSELELKWEQTANKLKNGSDKKFFNLQSVMDNGDIPINTPFEVLIDKVCFIEGTKTAVMRFSDESGSSKTGEMYLHKKYYFLLEPEFCSLTLNTRRTIRFISSSCAIKPDTSKFLPSDLFLFILTDQDKDFIYKYFCGTKLSQISDLNNGNPFNLWVKVTNIESPSAARSRGRIRKLIVSIRDDSVDRDFHLILWDEQIRLSEFFKKGDCLGIAQPYISHPENQSIPSPIFEYGSSTILFLKPKLEEKDLISETKNSLKAIVKKDETGSYDMAMYPERIWIRDLQPCMSNVVLLGKIMALSENVSPSS